MVSWYHGCHVTTPSNHITMATMIPWYHGNHNTMTTMIPFSITELPKQRFETAHRSHFTTGRFFRRSRAQRMDAPFITSSRTIKLTDRRRASHNGSSKSNGLSARILIMRPHLIATLRAAQRLDETGTGEVAAGTLTGNFLRSGEDDWDRLRAQLNSDVRKCCQRRDKRFQFRGRVQPVEKRIRQCHLCFKLLAVRFDSECCVAAIELNAQVSAARTCAWCCAYLFQ